MPGQNDERQQNNRRFRVVGDRTLEQALFLEAIRKNAYRVLADLYRSVLPSFREALQRRPRTDFDPWFWDPDRSASAARWRRAFWSADYDMDTWQAVWDWAARAQLTAGLDLGRLRAPAGISIAQWYYETVHWRRKKSLWPLYRERFFTTDDSLTVIFAMPLVETVWLTLRSWTQQEPQPDELGWNLPESSLISLRQRPYAYTLRVLPWNVFGEKRADAKKRMMADVEKQLEKELDKHARLIATKPHLEACPEIREKEHFDWLVLYQVIGLTYSDVARKVGVQRSKSGSNNDDTHRDTDVFRSEKGRVTSGIKTAAERLIGPRFTAWLRPGRPGRRRRSDR
jgi:hypothetical protein